MADFGKRIPVRQMAPTEKLVHAVVADQPVSVTELTPAILARYKFRDGSVKIAGCSIDDVPLFEIRHIDGSPFESGDATGDSTADSTDDAVDDVSRSPAKMLNTLFVDSGGKVLDSEFAGSLGVNEATDLPKLPEKIRPSLFDEIWQAARAKITAAFASNPVRLERVIWCKQATGKVGVQSGDANAQVAFHGWTRRLVNGLDLPPPFTCEYTGKCSYEIITDSEHRLTVPEAIGTCSVSGSQVVQSVLLESALSGKFALPKHIVKCSVSGDLLLENECEQCRFCKQPISPAKRKGNGCAGCAKIPLATDSLLEKYGHSLPANFNRRSVRIRESFACVHLSCSTGRTKHLLVLDRETGELIRHKQKSGWFGKWISVS